MTSEIDQSIRAFSGFLSKSFESANNLLNRSNCIADEDIFSDWLQANWELLVERNVLQYNEYLEVYGSGADFNGASSRITEPSALPTHRVVARAVERDTVFDLLSSQEILAKNLEFIQLAGFYKQFYTLVQDFDCALLLDRSNDTEVLVSLHSIKFEIIKLQLLY